MLLVRPIAAILALLHAKMPVQNPIRMKRYLCVLITAMCVLSIKIIQHRLVEPVKRYPYLNPRAISRA